MLLDVTTQELTKGVIQLYPEFRAFYQVNISERYQTSWK